MHAQRTHVATDVIPVAAAGDPAVAAPAPEGASRAPTGTPLAPEGTALAPNVRVAPAGAHPGPAGQAGPRGGWDCGAGEDEAQAAGDPAPGGPARDGARRPGRPRSERAEQAIIDATIEAIGENGIDGVHCEDVAARAGVGKATLYRRWPGKEDLLIAAFAAMRRPLPDPRGESVRADLIALLDVIAADAGDPRHAQQYALLHGAGDRYPRLVAGYKERVVEPRREAVRAVLRRGMASGELRPDTDVEVAMLMLSGAVMARGKHERGPAEPGFTARVVDELLRGIAFC
jgi:AcrR family transcriptional regulator